jgi:hypothetical protein
MRKLRMWASLKDRSGQGIIGVIVSAGLLLVMVAGVMSVLDNTMKTQKGSSQTADFAALISELTPILQDRDNATTALAGMPLISSAAACPTTGVAADKITWNGATLVALEGRYNQLYINKLCLKKVDDAWAIGTNTYLATLTLEATKTDSAGGGQRLTHDFYVVVKVSAGNVVEAEDFYIAGNGCAKPTSCTLTHTTNMKTFTVSWTAGSCNGGANGCKLQYLLGSTWTDLAGTYNCDATATNEAATLPNDGWLYGQSWDWSGATGIKIRMVRVTDGAVMCGYGFTGNTFNGDGGACGSGSCLSCTSVVGAAGPGNSSRDENCNGYWNELNPVDGLYY